MEKNNARHSTQPSALICAIHSSRDGPIITHNASTAATTNKTTKRRRFVRSLLSRLVMTSKIGISYRSRAPCPSVGPSAGDACGLPDHTVLRTCRWGFHAVKARVLSDGWRVRVGGEAHCETFGRRCACRATSRSQTLQTRCRASKGHTRASCGSGGSIHSPHARRSHASAVIGAAVPEDSRGAP